MHRTTKFIKTIMTENQILANHFFKLGLNVTCITKYITEHNFYDANILKGPSHEWEHLKNEKQSLKELNSYDWEEAVGIGTIAGFNNLRVLDIDGCSNYDFVEDILQYFGLPTHYEWVVKSGSQNGFHIYFYSDLLSGLEIDYVVSSYPPNIDNLGLFEKIEVLWGTHVVLPPSLHKSGFQYSFTNCKYPKSLPLNIEIEKFKSFEKLFLNVTKYEFRRTYFRLSEEANSKIVLPNNIEIVDLSVITNPLFFLFDIETDGLIIDNKYPNIIQISWMIMDLYGVVYKKNTELVNSDFDEKSESLKINKLNPEIIRKIGKEPLKVYQELSYDLKYCTVISAHNLKFDLSILQNELDKNNVSFNLNKLEKFCTMEWGLEKFKSHDNLNPKYPKLTEIYKYLFDNEVNQIHNAQSDVSILAKCVKKIINRKELIFWWSK